MVLISIRLRIELYLFAYGSLPADKAIIEADLHGQCYVSVKIIVEKSAEKKWFNYISDKSSTQTSMN